MERFIDPAVADLQAESADAIRRGSLWRSCWTLLAGYVALAKVFLLCGLFGTRQAWRNWNAEDVRGMSRVVWHTVAAIIGLTMFLALPELLRLRDIAKLGDPSTTLLALYLLPSTMALSVPVGLAIGTALGVGRRPRSRRLIAALLLIAAVTSVFSFTNVGWLTPAFNRLYREEVFNQFYREDVSGVRPLSKGYNELTFTELRHAIGDPDTRFPRASTTYHTRLALAAAPLTFAIFSLVIATRRHLARWAAMIVVSAGIASYLLISIGRNTDWGLLPASLDAWAPQILLVMVTILVGRLESGTGTSLTRTRA